MTRIARRLVVLGLLSSLGCGPRMERMRPAVGAPAVDLGVHVVRAIEASSDYSAPSLRVIAPDMLADVLRGALTDAGVYGPAGRYVLRARIVKLEGGRSGVGFNCFATLAVENQLVDGRDPAWDWRKKEISNPGLFPFPGLEQYSGTDGQRDAFEAAVREVAGETVQSVRGTLERRAAEERERPFLP